MKVLHVLNVNLATALNGVPKEQNERGDGGVLVILLHDGHGDGGDREGEEGAGARFPREKLY